MVKAVPLVRPPGLAHWGPALVRYTMQWGSGCGARSRPRPLRPVLGLWLAGHGPLRYGGLKAAAYHLDQIFDLNFTCISLEFHLKYT